MSNIIGKPVDRKDGKLKVTGGALYAAEFPVKDIAYGVTVQSKISSGHIESIDATATKSLKGVIDVMTYKNAMNLHTLASGSNDPGSGKYAEKDFLPLQTDRIYYNGQHIAVVIAETFEIAQHGATLLKVTYNEAKPVVDIKTSEKYQPSKSLSGGAVQSKRGDIETAMASAPIKFEQTYNTPVYHHNPMETHATSAAWTGDELLVYDATQSVFGCKNAIATMLGIQQEKVRVISPFIGGGFGSKGFIWANSLLAPMAAKLVNRPVKIVLNRTEQMFTAAGRRSQTIQTISFGADAKGKITSAKHETTSETSFVDEFVETAGVATKMLYDFQNLDIVQNLTRLNKVTPCPTRAPGEAPGTYALEVALDELAYQAKIDPLELRLINYADKNPEDKKEFSLKNLRECYEKGAKSIGWSQRNPMPGMTKEGNFLIGYGMATATYPANRSKATVKLKLYQDGHAVAVCCTQDIGTGTYTVMAQLMAEALGLPIEKVEFKLGDSMYPQGPNSGGSQTMATTGPAVRAAALQAKSNAIQLAMADKKSPFYQQKEEDILVEDGKMFMKNDPSKTETYTQLLGRNKMDVIDAEATTDVTLKDGSKKPPPETPTDPKKPKPKENEFAKKDEKMDREKFSFHSFGAHFVKVKVDPLIGMVKVEKIVSVMDVGKILNEKTAKSQIMGGAVWGIGMALMEGSVYDERTGRIVTKDLADYYIPVHADMPEFDIQFTDKADYNLSLVGSRGAGEIGITGITAAIANAIYHATGKRVRDLPITPDKLLV